MCHIYVYTSMQCIVTFTAVKMCNVFSNNGLTEWGLLEEKLYYNILQHHNVSLPGWPKG